MRPVSADTSLYIVSNVWSRSAVERIQADVSGCTLASTSQVRATQYTVHSHSKEHDQGRLLTSWLNQSSHFPQRIRAMLAGTSEAVTAPQQTIYRRIINVDAVFSKLMLNSGSFALCSTGES